MNSLPTHNASQTNLRVVKTETKPNGESIQLVRPFTNSAKSTAQIVGDLVNNFSYKTMSVKAAESELHAVQRAFGSSLASELINTYDGSHLVSDSQQDLIGERYLAEQIKLIEQQQKNSSVLNKWSHLLYEGEKYEKLNKSSSTNVLTTVTEVTSNAQTTLSSTTIPKAESNTYLPTEYLPAAGQNFETVMKSDESLLNDIIQQVRAEQDNVSRGYENNDLNSESLNQTKIESDLRGQGFEQAQEEEKLAKMLADAQFFSKNQAETQFANKIRLESEEQNSPVSTSRGGAEFYKKSSSQQNSNLRRSGSQHIQQPTDYLPKLSSSNLNSVSLDAYNNPQFKAMLAHILKPIEAPAPEEFTYPTYSPSAETIASLCEPIYIPAPLPIVIPAPQMIIQREYKEFPKELIKPYVTQFPSSVPSIATDQSHYQNFGIRQINL